MTAALGGCGSDGSLGEEPTLTGAVNGWKWTALPVAAFVNGDRVATGTVDAGGVLSVKLPPGSSFGSNLRDTEFCPPSDRFSDNVCDYAAYTPTKPQTGVLELTTEKCALMMSAQAPDGSKPLFVSLFYTPQDFTLTGTLTQTSKSNGSVSTTRYDLHMRAGWNYFITDEAKGGGTIRSGALPDSAVWQAIY